MKCYKLHSKYKFPCTKKECRYWMEYEGDLNCTILAVEKNDNVPMTLREIAERLGVSFVRVKQIQSEAIRKLGAKGLKISDLKQFLTKNDTST